MNLLEATVSGGLAQVPGSEVVRGASYKPLAGRTQIGIRPEYCTLSRDEGLPLAIRRIEDVGRHRIVRGEMFGQPFNVIAPEGTEIGADMSRVVFAPSKINVYADDWRVAGGAL